MDESMDCNAEIMNWYATLEVFFALGCITAYVCMKNIMRYGEYPLKFRIRRFSIMIHTNDNIANKVVLLMLDVLHFSWSIYGLAMFNSNIKNSWK